MPTWAGHCPRSSATSCVEARTPNVSATCTLRRRQRRASRTASRPFARRLTACSAATVGSATPSTSRTCMNRCTPIALAQTTPARRSPRRRTRWPAGGGCRRQGDDRWRGRRRLQGEHFTRLNTDGSGSTRHATWSSVTVSSLRDIEHGSHAPSCASGAGRLVEPVVERAATELRLVALIHRPERHLAVGDDLQGQRRRVHAGRAAGLDACTCVVVEVFVRDRLDSSHGRTSAACRP